MATNYGNYGIDRVKASLQLKQYDYKPQQSSDNHIIVHFLLPS